MHTDLWPPIGTIRAALAPLGTPGQEMASEPLQFGTFVAGAGDATPVEAGAPPADADAADAEAALNAPCYATANLVLPLAELARRRTALAQRAYPAQWAPGRLVGIRRDGLLYGVLLARQLPGDHWQGWLAASEADWAGPFDVLLEPADEPFEPLFGVIQVWNPVTVRTPRPDTIRVFGELSATRLAALGAVHEEAHAQRVPAVSPDPGRIAVRGVADTFSVLCGTPLGTNDPRADYQALYREAAARLSVVPVAAPGRAAEAASAELTRPGLANGGLAAHPATPASGAPDATGTKRTRTATTVRVDDADVADAALQAIAAYGVHGASGTSGTSGARGAQAPSTPDAAPASSAHPPRQTPQPPARPGMLTRLRRWFGEGDWVRPAFAALALVVVVQNVGLFAPAPPEEEVRFRNLSAPEALVVDLVVTWKAGVSVQDSAQLLRSLSANVVAGPDAQGRWYLRVPDPKLGERVLGESPLVEAVSLR